MVYISSCCSSYFYLFYLGPSNTCAICAMGHWESYPACRSVHFGWPPPTPHSRVHGMDLWVRCPDACMRPGIQCTTEPGPNTRRSTLGPTSTLAHPLVVIYWASSRLARSPKYPLHNIAFVWKRDMISANMHKICHQVGNFQWTTLEPNPIWKL
jgi:hypothetical protein